MKNKRYFIASVIQLVIGIIAIASFFAISTSGENMTKWVITLVLAVAYVVLGIIGIIDCKTKK